MNLNGFISRRDVADGPANYRRYQHWQDASAHRVTSRNYQRPWRHDRIPLRPTIALFYGVLCHACFALGVGRMVVMMFFGMSRSLGALVALWSSCIRFYSPIEGEPCSRRPPTSMPDDNDFATLGQVRCPR